MRAVPRVLPQRGLALPRPLLLLLLLLLLEALGRERALAGRRVPQLAVKDFAEGGEHGRGALVERQRSADGELRNLRASILKRDTGAR